jgi:thioredoxin
MAAAQPNGPKFALAGAGYGSINQFSGGSQSTVGRLLKPAPRSSTKLNASFLVSDIDNDDFEKMVLEESKNQPVIVDFWASWCGPCKLMSIIFTKVALEFEGKPVKFIKFDLDKNKQMAKAYNIDGLPAIMIFKDGKKVPDYHLEGCPSDSKDRVT